MSIVITVAVTLLIFGILVTVHELGHYLVARACGVAIIEFSIGMGPKIKSWEGKINTFSIRALPVGGYVRMAGEPGEDDDAETLAACVGRAPINEVHIFKRMLIVLAVALIRRKLRERAGYRSRSADEAGDFDGPVVEVDYEVVEDDREE